MTIKDLNISFSSINMKLLLFFMFVCPIFYFGGFNFGQETLRIGQEQFYQMGSAVLFAVVFVENIYLVSFLLWTVFLYVMFRFPVVGSNYVINIFWALVLYQVSYKVVNQENCHKLFKILLWLCVLNLFWISLQKFGVDPVFADFTTGKTTQDGVGWLGLKAFVGMFFAMCIPFICSINLFLAPWFFIPIYFSECSVAMAGGLVALLWHLWHVSKKLFYVALLISVLGGGFYIYKDSGMGMMTDRMNLWRVVTKDCFRHPVTGWGLDSFRNLNEFKPFIYFKRISTTPWDDKSERFIFHRETKTFIPPPGFLKPEQHVDPWDNAHNEFIQLFFEFGMLPFFILICLIRDMKKRFSSSDKNVLALSGYFFTLLIFSIGQFPFHVARIGFSIPIMLGAYYKLTDENRRYASGI